MSLRAGKLKAIAAERGLSVLDLVEEEVERTGSVARAAISLKVNPAAIRYHLDKAGKTVTKRTVVVEREGAATK